MKKSWLALFLVMICTQTVGAEGPGSTSANFLKAGQGVRAIAMGETYIALGDGLDTLNWNPAGLVQMTSPAANFSHSFWFQDIGTEYIAYGMPLGPLGAVAGGVTIMHAGTVTETLEDNQGNYLGEGSQITPMSFALVGGYSQKLSRLVPSPDPFIKNTIVGANIKIVTESLDDVAVFGGALDIGAIWRETEEVKSKQVTTQTGDLTGKEVKPLVRDHGWRLGMVAQNLGMTSSQVMPINFRAGIGYLAQELFSEEGKGTLAVDVLIPVDNDIKITVGGEYEYRTAVTAFAIRAGYKIGPEINDLDSLAGLTSGVGLTVNGGLFKYQVDYAFVPYGELGSTHRLALTLHFLPEPN